jgi:hypothetical protein
MSVLLNDGNDIFIQLFLPIFVYQRDSILHSKNRVNVDLRECVCHGFIIISAKIPLIQ